MTESKSALELATMLCAAVGSRAMCVGGNEYRSLRSSSSAPILRQRSSIVRASSRCATWCCCSIASGSCCGRCCCCSSCARHSSTSTFEAAAPLRRIRCLRTRRTPSRDLGHRRSYEAEAPAHYGSSRIAASVRYRTNCRYVYARVGTVIELLRNLPLYVLTIVPSSDRVFDALPPPRQSHRKRPPRLHDTHAFGGAS
jgi:hypothetical protein